jgi:hypothetical protein
MRRTIYFALFGLLVPSGAAFPQARAVRPHVRVVVVRLGAHRAVFPRYGIFYPFSYPVPYPVPYPVWTFITPAPVDVFAGTVSESHPQLVFKDGTTYTVTDYWRTDSQLHFITSEEGGTKSVPHIVPFGDLDVQRTTDADKAGGFRFVVRNEPVEEWLDHHSQHR